MKLIVLTLLFISLTGCVKFAGCDLEVSTGTDQGIDQGAPTHKMTYGVLGRLRYDANK